MLWLIVMLASVGVSAASVVVTLQRMGGNHERSFREAPALAPAAFAEGSYGRITGVVTARPPVETPGVGTPSVLYELVVYRTVDAGYNSWRIIHRARVGDELVVQAGDTVVRVSGHDVYLLDAPAYDTDADLAPRPSYGRHRSRVRYVPDGATVQIVGTLTREVDDDPAAPRDYRETATRYRLIGTRRQPIVLACEPRRALPPGDPD